MIRFTNKYYRIYNEIIHNFMDMMLSDNKEKIGCFIEDYMPTYLRRELYVSCVEAYFDLYYWTNDTIDHEMTSLHNLVLYEFIEFMIQVKRSTPLFNKRFYSEHIINDIEKVIRSKQIEEGEISIRKIKCQFFDLRLYKKLLFQNTEFLRVVKRITQNSLIDYSDFTSQEQDKYFNILPDYMQKKIRTDAIDIVEMMKGFFDFVSQKITNGNFSFLFWDGNKSVNEEKIQILIFNLMDAYFYKKDINIIRESQIGRGRIDFTCYINKKECLLIEIKKASNPNLKVGFEEQTFKYMKSSRCDKAVYLIFCFSDKDMEKASYFVHNHKKDDIYHTYINIIILDVRKENRHIILNNESRSSRQIPNIIDTYFSELHQISKIKSSKEAVVFLLQLQENYAKLYNETLENDFHAYLMNIILNNTEIKIHNYYGSERFYCIYTNEDACRLLLLRVLLIIRHDDLWISEINKVRKFFESLDESNHANCIMMQTIEDIFNYMKMTRTYVYKFLSNKHIDICLFDEVNLQTDIISIAWNNYSEGLLCQFNYFYTAEQRNMNPIYSFYEHLCNFIYLNIALEKEQIITEYIDNIFQKPIELNNIDMSEIFISGLTVYLMHDTKYKYDNPYCALLEGIYKKIHKFFDELFESLEDVKYDLF